MRVGAGGGGVEPLTALPHAAADSIYGRCSATNAVFIPGDANVAAFTPLPNPLPLGRVKTYSIAGELFPTQRLGVAPEYARRNGDPLLEAEYELSTTWFVRPSFALKFSIGRRHAEPASLDDTDVAALSLLGRF